MGNLSSRAKKAVAAMREGGGFYVYLAHDRFGRLASAAKLVDATGARISGVGIAALYELAQADMLAFEGKDISVSEDYGRHGDLPCGFYILK